MELSRSELRELNLRRSGEDLKVLVEALLNDGEITVVDDEEPAEPADETELDEPAPLVTLGTAEREAAEGGEEGSA